MTNHSIELSLSMVRAVAAGSIVYPPGGKFGPRIQQDLQLVMLYTGEMTVVIDGRELRILPGQVVLLKPSHEEMFIFSTTEQSWHRWIAIHLQDMPGKLIDELYRLPEVITLTSEMNQLTDLILSVQRHMENDSATMLHLGLSAIHLYPLEASRWFIQKEKHPAVYATLSFVHEQYADTISLQLLAEKANLSSEHLVRLFKQSIQMTPMHYVWTYRVEKAIELLQYTGLTISEIAHRCGFKTSHHFARLIKRQTGKTASTIRQLAWNGTQQYLQDSNDRKE